MRNLVLAVLFGWISSVSANERIYQQDGIAIDGYDAVAYHLAEAATRGDAAIRADWMGTTWLFSSAANRDLFVADPERYAPLYGGYCAYAASKNYIASTDGEAWSVVDGKLYLNYSKPVRLLWGLDRDNHIASANENWPGLRAGLE